MTTKRPISMNKFGARVYPMSDDTVLVYQTVKRGKRQNSPYVVDQKPEETGERFLDLSDDSGIAEAVRAAFRGEL